MSIIHAEEMFANTADLDASQGRLYNEDEVARIVQMAAYRAANQVMSTISPAAGPNLDNSLDISMVRVVDDQNQEVTDMPSSFEKQITLSDGRVVRLRGKSLSDALEKALCNLVRQTNEPQSTVLFADYARNWFKLYHEPNCGARWLKESKLLLEKHILPYFGARVLSAITVSDVQQFFNGKSTLSLSTNKHIRYLLNGILDSALEDNLVSRNVMVSKRLVVRGSEKPRKALSVEQVRDICLHMPKLCLQDQLLLSLLLYTGMRRGEILALEWSQVDFDRQLIHVEHSVDFTDSNTPVLKAPKSKAGERVIPILPPLMNILKTAKGQASGRFLLGASDCPLTKRAYEWQYRHLRQVIDLHGATAHVFRHTFITMCSCYLDPKTLQSIAGHAKCDITLNRYAHAQQEQIAKAGEKLGDLYAVV